MSTAIDARVSTERQTLAQTIAQQVERLTAHVHAHGETLRSEEIFRDDGYRGATLNRPGLDRLRDRVKEATIEQVIITSPDGSNEMDPPLSSVALMSQNGCDIVGNHSPRGGRSHGTADERTRHRHRKVGLSRRWHG
jgi:predicted site-specific integrase-resolvase